MADNDVLQQEEPEPEDSKPEEQGEDFTRDRAADALERPLHPLTLLGSWFHQYDGDKIVAQGLIVGEPSPFVRTYLLQFYEGGSVEEMRKTYQQAWAVEDMQGQGWRFYDTQEELCAAWYAYVARDEARS